MIELGRINLLQVVREEEHGLYLEAGGDGEILLPIKQVEKDIRIGDRLPVFVYRDSEDRLIATTNTPKALVGDFAVLKVMQVTSHGAFLDWGLEKDLMLPFGEQKRKVSQGINVVVRVYVDEETRRIAATTKLGRYLDKTDKSYIENQEVKVMIVDRTDLGYRCVVENQHWGLLYHNQIFQPISIGQSMTAFVQSFRPDGKLDLIIEKPGPEKAVALSKQILDRLEQNHGFINLGDKSDPSEILAMFNVSKKTYKRALSQLYKEKKIIFDGDGIRLVAE